MNRKVRWVGALLTLGLLLSALFFRHSDDPILEGKTLSKWLENIQIRDQLGPDESLRAALKEINGDGIILLRTKLRGIRFVQSPAYDHFYHHWVPQRARKFFFDPAKEAQIRENAAWMLSELKERAEPAVPELAMVVSDAGAPKRTRGLACATLEHLGRKASKAVSALVGALHDQDDSLRESAARTLGVVGHLENVSDLKLALGTNRNYVTIGMAEAIWKLQPSQSNYACAVIRDSLRDSRTFSKLRGSQVLWDITRDTDTVPILIAVLRSSDYAFHSWSIHLLGRMGQKAAPAADLVKEKIDFDGSDAPSNLKAQAEALAPGIREAAVAAFAKISEAN